MHCLLYHAASSGSTSVDKTLKTSPVLLRISSSTRRWSTSSNWWCLAASHNSVFSMFSISIIIVVIVTTSTITIAINPIIYTLTNYKQTTLHSFISGDHLLLPTVIHCSVPVIPFPHLSSMHYTSETGCHTINMYSSATWQPHLYTHIETGVMTNSFNPFNASCSKLLLFEGSSATLV